MAVEEIIHRRSIQDFAVHKEPETTSKLDSQLTQRVSSSQGQWCILSFHELLRGIKQSCQEMV